MQQTLAISNLSELPSAAGKLLTLFPDEKIFAFYGDMGVGKTTFITELCKQLGVTDTISSPTFSIINEYKSGKGERIFHFDFYRIKSIDEVYDLGYEDYFYSRAFCFIEWSEKIEDLLPDNYVKVSITKEGEKRVITIE